MRRMSNRPGLALLLSALFVAPLSAQSPSLPLPARPPKPAGAPAAPAKLPAARELIDAHLKAIGGREAVLSHSSSRATGTIEIASAGISGALEVFSAKPNRSLMRFTLPGVGEMQEGFDGTVGWSMSALTGPSVLEGKQLEQRKFDSDFYSELHDDDRYDSITTVEQTTFDGRSCYKVRLVRRGGGEDFEFYDVQSGLKAGSITTREMPMGTVTATTVESDYRKFGGMLVPTKLRQSAMGLETVMTISSMEFDTVDPAVFEPPAAIKALVK